MCNKLIIKLLPYALIWTWYQDVTTSLVFYNLPNNQLVEENTAINSTVFVIGIQNYTENDTNIWWSHSPAEGSTLFALGPVESSEIVVSTQSELDFESLTASLFTFIVVLSDQTETVTGTLTISVHDVNENGTWASSSYYTSVQDGAAVGHIVQDPGFTYLDPDVGDTATCSMDCQSNNRMSPSCNITVTSSYSLDKRSSSSSLECNVVAVDKGSNSVTTTLTISIVDANNFVPIFESASYQFTIAPHESADTVIGKVKATDTDTGTYGDFTYSLDQSAYATHYFKIDSDTGQISTQLDMSTCNCPLTTFSLPVYATDQGGLVGNSIVHITTGVTTTTSITTTTTPSTTTAVYKTFFEDTGNLVWFSIMLALVAVTVCVTGLILLKYGCRSMWFTRKSIDAWRTQERNPTSTAPISVRQPPPPVLLQAWRKENVHF